MLEYVRSLVEMMLYHMKYCIGSCTSKGGDGVDIIREDVVISCESKDCTCDDVACDVMGEMVL